MHTATETTAPSLLARLFAGDLLAAQARALSTHAEQLQPCRPRRPFGRPRGPAEGAGEGRKR